MSDQDLLRQLHTTAAELQISHDAFREVGREDVCQLLREAVLKVGIAMHLHQQAVRRQRQAERMS